MTLSRWRINLSNENNVTLEDVKFIFSQAEKRLEDTVKTGESIAQKTAALTAFLAAIIVGASTYVFDKWSAFPLDNKIIVALLAIVYPIGVFVYMLKNVFPNHYHVAGSLPKDLVVDAFFSDTIPREKQTIYLIMSEIENYQFRTESNLQVNNERWSNYVRAVVATLLTPAALVIAYCTLELIR